MITGAALLYFYIKVNGDDANDIAIALSGAPSIESVERRVKSGVEDLLTEDNTNNNYYQLDRFFLSEQTDPLTYIGSLKATGVIAGGMIPKIDCCETALKGGVPRTHIIDGRVPHSLLIEMFSDRGIGTMIY